MAKAATVVLSAEERSVLESWLRAGTTERRMSERARMILRLGEGASSVAVAREMKTRPARVSEKHPPGSCRPSSSRYSRQPIASLLIAHFAPLRALVHSMSRCGARDATRSYPSLGVKVSHFAGLTD